MVNKLLTSVLAESEWHVTVAGLALWLGRHHQQVNEVESDETLVPELSLTFTVKLLVVCAEKLSVLAAEADIGGPGVASCCVLLGCKPPNHTHDHQHVLDREVLNLEVAQVAVLSVVSGESAVEVLEDIEVLWVCFLRVLLVGQTEVDHAVVLAVVDEKARPDRVCALELAEVALAALVEARLRVLWVHVVVERE